MLPEQGALFYVGGCPALFPERRAVSNPSARIRCKKHKLYPFALRVCANSKGVHFDLEDTAANTRRFITTLSNGGARNLARWILDNVEE